MSERSSIALDANLLTVLLVGSQDRSFVGRHKRTQAFLPEDYDRLLWALGRFSVLVATPNTLTETSHLIRQGDKRRSRTEHLRTLCESRGTEVYITSAKAAENPAFFRLGLADAAIVELARIHPAIWIVTVDFDLYQALQSAGHARAVNFNHVREHGWDLFSR